MLLQILHRILCVPCIIYLIPSYMEDLPCETFPAIHRFHMVHTYQKGFPAKGAFSLMQRKVFSRMVPGRKNSMYCYQLPYYQLINQWNSKKITDFCFVFYVLIFDAFLPNFMSVSLPLLKLWLFFKRLCSQNDDFTVKTLYKWQTLEIAVKCENLKIYTWNFARILVYIRVLRLQENLS